MRIIIATALFPPEIEHTATYVKELAERLKDKHQVQILAYAGQVEAIPGVKVFTINKKQPIFLRITKYFFKLYKLAKKADLIYVQNSAAVTLPTMLVQKLTKKPVVLNFIEDEVWKRARHLHLTDKSWEQFLQQAEIDKKISQIYDLQKAALQQADKVIFSSNSLAQAVSKSYNLPADKLVVNYPVADAKIALPFEQVINKNQILVFGQDFDLGIDQWDKNWKVILADKQVLSKAELSYLINTSALVVYNIASENFDNFLINCLSANKNILAHQTSYTQEILGQFGALLDFNDKLAVIEKVKQLLNNQTFNKNTHNRFDWSNHLAKLQEVFKASVQK